MQRHDGPAHITACFQLAQRQRECIAQAAQRPQVVLNRRQYGNVCRAQIVACEAVKQATLFTGSVGVGGEAGFCSGPQAANTNAGPVWRNRNRVFTNPRRRLCWQWLRDGTDQQERGGRYDYRKAREVAGSERSRLTGSSQSDRCRAVGSGRAVAGEGCVSREEAQNEMGTREGEPARLADARDTVNECYHPVNIQQIPALPWQLTGNHWLTIPCIHPADGSIHGLGVLNRGARAAIEFAGSANFVTGEGAPLLRPVLRVNGEVRTLSDEGIAWERAIHWLPTFTCTVGSLLVRGTVFAPYGRDADMAGAVYVLTIENRGDSAASVELSLEGQLGHRQQRVRTPRPFDDEHQVTIGGNDMLLLEGTAIPGMAAIAIGSDGDATLEVPSAPSRTPQVFAIRRSFSVPANEATQCAFYIAVGPERDGAQATVGVLRRRGWRALLTATREALTTLEQTTGSDAIDGLVNRNLLFAYFYGVGRALDDAHYYLVRSRAPWHGAGCTVRDWEALMWTLPAVQLADNGLARELLVRACELHGYAPGQGVHYMDGTLFQPGFALEGPAAYAIATDRYIRDSGDDHIVEDPIVADTLYLASEDIAARRDEHVPLYSTEVMPSGEPAKHPFTLHGNAVVALALDVLRRTLDEEAAKTVQDPAAVRAALRRHFAVDRGGKARLASAIDLAGGVSMEDDPVGSLLWLPLYEALDREDSLYRRSVRAISNDSGALLPHLARLLGPDAPEVLIWLRRAVLDNGIAAEFVDADGKATGNGGDAALAGLLAHTLWYAAHALGLKA